MILEQSLDSSEPAMEGSVVEVDSHGEVVTLTKRSRLTGRSPITSGRWTSSACFFHLLLPPFRVSKALSMDSSESKSHTDRPVVVLEEVLHLVKHGVEGPVCFACRVPLLMLLLYGHQKLRRQVCRPDLLHAVDADLVLVDPLELLVNPLAPLMLELVDSDGSLLKDVYSI